MTKPLPILVAFVALVAGGIAHGLLTERWYRSPVLEQALSRVAEVPLAFADWKGKELTTDDEAFQQAGAQVYWMRQYTNEKSKATVVVILMCGRAGRMAVHTPEVCYQGAGYEMMQPAPTEVLLRPQGAHSKENASLGFFWTARFAKETEAGADLRLYWSWNDGEGWQAPRNPRWFFRRRPFLYKLYVSRETNPASTQHVDQGTMDFLQQLVPVLDKTLFPEEKAAR